MRARTRKASTRKAPKRPARTDRARALSLAEARALDAQAAKKFRIATRLLMENAGAACAREIVRAWHSRKGRVLLFCGSGGNGGDGYVIARHLLLEGVPVVVCPVGNPKRRSDAADAFASWRALSAHLPPTKLEKRALRINLVVDAVLGTGVTRAVSGRALLAVNIINSLRAQGAHVISVDLPSGIDTDTGAPHGAAVRAHITIAIAALKRGLTCRESTRFRGRVVVVPFGAPAQLRG